MERMPKMGESVLFLDESRIKRAAIVVRVWGDTCVNLAVLDDTHGEVKWYSSVVQGNGQYNWEFVE